MFTSAKLKESKSSRRIIRGRDIFVISVIAVVDDAN